MVATLTSWKYYIIEPEAAINLCVNPSAESAIAGIYAGTNCTVTQSSEQARYGKYSVKGVPTGANTAAYIYTTITPTAAVSHTFSVSVFGVAGVNYTVQIQLASNGTVISSTPLVGNGHWQRAAVTATLTTAAYNLIVERVANQNTTAAFYADGFLFKTGADNLYFDGDTVDPYQDTPQFYWTGTPHASTSVRLASTRYGGTLLDLSQYCKVTAIQGLGLTSFGTNTTGLALGGEIYQNSHANARRFSLICRASTPMTSAFGTLQRKLARLEKAVNPKRMKVDQPLRLLIYGVDSAGTQASDAVLLDCVYESGLEGALENRAPSFPLTFHMDNPVIKADGYNVTSLSPSEYTWTLGSNNMVAISLDTGSYTLYDTWTGVIYGIKEDNKGGFYVYGAFTDKGDANGDRIVYCNSAGSFSSLKSGANSLVKDVAIGANGKVYICGCFTDYDDANGDYIVSWDGFDIASLGTGLNGYCYCLAIDNSGNLFAGGVFTTAGGITVNRIAKWNGTAWAALGTGTVGVGGTAVNSIVCLPNNKVVFGGNFTDAGGIADYDYLATFDGTNYGALGTAPNGAVNKLIYDQESGRLYAFGAFTQIGGITANYAAYWDGNNWNPMPGATSAISYANLGENNTVYALSSFLINGITFNTTAYWTGSEWRTPEFENLGYDSSLYNVCYRKITNELFLFVHGDHSAAVAVPSVSAITNSTEGNIYPSVTLDATGYYVYSLYNRSTGERIFLNGLMVGTGEKIELVFYPNGYTITSNIRGDMRSAVLSGSSPTFHLQPGVNYVSCFVHPSPTGGVTIPLKYPAAAYISLNETVYE